MSAPPVLGLAEASRALASGRVSSRELVETSLARIGALEPELHAFIDVTADRALDAAGAADSARAAGRARSVLDGIPYALKDIYDARGLRTTCHSRVMKPTLAERDSDAAERLDAAGMALLGKLSTHEFAIGTPGPDAAFPNARNPWNPGHFAGGSSSGSAVAVASGMVPLAMGSDTGGSIRLPAAYCGIVGLKPTYGRLSRFGIFPLAFSMDHAGPLTRTVEDCALALQVLAGHDPRDPASADVAVPDYLAELRTGVAGLRIGYARAFHAEAGVGPDQEAALDAAAGVFSGLGAEVEEVALPSRARFDAAGWTILHAEALAIHQRDLQARPGDYARPTRERLMLGAFVSGVDYVRASRLRRIVTEEVNALVRRYDALIVSPTAGAAPALSLVEDTPLRRDRPLTVLFNVTGHPAICLPGGFGPGGLPLSIQLAGSHFGEAKLMRIAHAYEEATAWTERRPALG